MKVLVVGKPISNAKHGAEVGVIAALKRMGYDVDIFDLGTNSPIKSLDKKHDMVLCLGAGIPGNKANYKLIKKVVGTKSILWNSKPIRLPEYYNKVNKQKYWFNAHATFDAGEIPLYEKMGCRKVVFLPQAANPDWYKPLDVEPSKFCCFVGSIGGKWRNRQAFINRVLETIPKSEMTVTTCFNGNEVNKIYNDHKLVLNLGLYHYDLGPANYLSSYGIQQRVFESYTAGVPCLTNIPADHYKVPAYDRLFAKGKEVIYYNSENLDAVLRYYYDNQNELYKIRENIRNNYSKHTYEERLRHFFCLVINHQLWS